MPQSPFLFVVIILISCEVCLSLKADYCWREYTGEIPGDAIIAGTDINAKNIYIGQAYIKNEGLIVVQITEGVREVKAPINGVKTVDKYTKILCGPQEKFYWMKGEAKSLHLNLIDKLAVIGGHENDQGYIGVGRISYDGETKIGKINLFSVGDINFFFNNNGVEKLVSSFEILMYNETLHNAINLRIDSS